MKKNMGAIDKLVRLVVALLIFITYYMDMITGVFGIVGLVIASVFILTSLVSVCPLYSIFGMSTCPAKEKK